MFRRDVVEGAELIVGAPPAPVRDRLEHDLELRDGDVRGPLLHRIAPGSGVSISPGSGRPTDSAPSTTIRCPDRYEASSEHIHRIGRAISSGSAKRPIGMRSSMTFDCTGWLMTNAESRVLMMPGARAL